MNAIEAIHTDTYSASPIPDGMVYLPDARTRKEVLVDLRDLPPGVLAQQPVAPAPAPIVQPQVVVQPARQQDPITKRILAGGLSTAGVLVAAGQYAPALSQVGHAVELGGLGLGVLAAGVAVFKGTSPKVEVNVTANITGASASSASDSSSAAGWRATSSS